MQPPEAIYQFFYASKESGLPHTDVPVRDITNTHHQGHKREPNLERCMENWCSCRAKSITNAATRALALEGEGGQHYLVLTTRHPRDERKALAVGLLPFSLPGFKAALRGNKSRWQNRYPYVSDQTLKICSFADGFRLEVAISKDDKTHVPGSRYAPVKVPSGILSRLISHFESKPNRLREFLANVRALEKRLKKTDLNNYNNYRSDNPSIHC